MFARFHPGHLLIFAVRCAIPAAAFPGIPALASSCSTDVSAQIYMAAGRACWTYRGAATSFLGKFSGGQAISAEMFGIATGYGPRSRRVATVSRPRDPTSRGRACSSLVHRRRRAF